MSDLITVFHNVKNFTNMKKMCPKTFFFLIWGVPVSLDTHLCEAWKYISGVGFTFHLLLLTDGLEPFYFIGEEAEI